MLAALTVAIAVAAVLLLFLVVADLPAYGIGPRIPWWALAVAFGVTELFVVHAHVRGSAHSLSLSELPLILGLLLATPQDLVIAQFAGPALVLAFSRRNSPIKLVFNLAQFGLTACLAVVTLHALAPVTEGLGPQLWFATFAAVTVSALSGATLVFAAITLAEGVIPSRRLALMMGVDLLVSLTNTSVGLAGATLVAQDSRAGWLLIAPACILLLAYRAYLSERTRHESLDFLYGVARSLSRAPDIETALADLLARTRDSFRVEVAEIVLFSDGETPLRTALGTAGEERMQPIEPSLAAALRACVPGEQAALVRRADASGELARYLWARGISEALVAPVPGETRLTGVMVLGDRVGAASSFSGEDVRLFETLANHAGMSLEYDRMRDLQARLEHQAFRDSLSGLANRALFLRRLEESLRRADGTTTVLFLDLDDFKAINDEHGHAAGDAVLVAVADRLRAAVRPGDLAARLGGDEFAVLLEDNDAAHGEAVAERVLDSLSQPVLEAERVWTHGSVGIAFARSGSVGADELIRRADVAMYRAKEAGKGQSRVWSPEMHPASLGRAPQARRDRGRAGGRRAGGALPADRLDRHRRGRGRRGPGPLGAPAPRAARPVRVRRRRRGDRPGRGHRPRGARARMLRRRLLGRVDGRLPSGAAVHSNLSGVGLRSFEVVGAIEDVLARTGLDPARLVLEITESVLVADLPMARRALSALRDLGVQIALDDFGTGHSSLQSLRELPVDVIKVAKPFVDGAARSPHDRALMRMMIEMGELFGVAVVAEGIEREDQLRVLRELGCEMGQGYLLGRPVEMPAGLPHAAVLGG